MKKIFKILLIFILFASQKVLSIEFDIKAKTAILQDYLSGEILYEKDADLSIYPASMTKIMTSIIAFEQIKNGDLSLDDQFIISKMLGDCLNLVIHLCLLWLEIVFLWKIY